MDRFEAMQTFVAVIEAGGFSPAAARLGVGKSVVSRRLADLETHLGARLVNRTTRRLSLTEAGEQYMEHCHRILAELEDAETMVASGQAALNGRLRVSAPVSFGVDHLAPVLAPFLEEHPRLVLDLDLDDRHVNLVEEGMDLALRIGHLTESSLVARRLAPIRFIACASEAYLKRYGAPATPRDLEEHHGLLNSNVPESMVWTFEGPDGERQTVHPPARMRANNGDFLLGAAAAGVGIAIQPTFIAYRHIGEGALVPVLTDYRIEPAALYAVYPSRHHLPWRVRLFIDYLSEVFGEVPTWDDGLPFIP